MSNTLFFKIEYQVKSFKPALLPNQETVVSGEITSTAEIDEINFPEASCLRYPLQTIFAATSFVYDKTAKKLIINDVYPIEYDKQCYYNGVPAENQITNPILDAYIEYNLDQNLTAYAKEIAELFKPFGLIVDVDAKIALRMASVAGAKGPAATGLMATIATDYPLPSVKSTGFHVEDDTWKLMIRNILRGENQLLIGPTGAGKTEIVKLIADAMGKKLFVVDMGTVQDPQSALLGVHRLNKEGFSVFDYAPFAQYIQEENAIILLDELSRSPLSANNLLFPCLDRRRYLPVDIAGDGEERHIPVHESVVFIATANLGAEYTGTMSIDRALMDRFFPVELSYPSETAEINVLNNRTGIDKKTAKQIVQIAKNIRKQNENQDLSSTVSVRHTLQVASLVVDGFDLGKSLMQVFLPLFETGNGADERAKVKTIIAAL
jgi:MoxR-like ATPase